ncbi:MAG: glycosyltransferase family 2 protein [Acidimicrobiales bacterium]
MRRLRNRPAGARTTVVRPRPADPSPLPSFRLIAVCFAFAEEDIIEATVMNAFSQGCDRFLLIDHSSPDETVTRAVAAGAEVVATPGADDPFEDTRSRLLDEIATSVSAETLREPTWWLHLDADEFPRGPGGRTIRAYLADLDSGFPVVGSTFYNHYPDREPANVRARHPIDFQPMCERELVAYCAAGHFKHQLLRVDPGAPSPRQWWGLHRPAATAEVPWPEPADGVITHHFPFRAEADFRRRSALVAERIERNRRHPIAGRSDHVSAVYSGDWDQVRLRRTRLGNRPVRLRDWRDFLPADDQAIPRWYEARDEA